MHHHFRNVLLVIFIAMLSACSIHIGHRHMIYDDDFFFELKAPNKASRNALSFNDDETDIEVLPESISLVIGDLVLGQKRRLQIENVSGKVEYEYRVNGKVSAYNSDAQLWFASQVPRILRETGINKTERIQRIYQANGAVALINEIALIESDSSKGAYLLETIQTIKLESSELSALISLSSTIESDATLSAILQAAVDSATSEIDVNAVLQPAKTIESDASLSSLLGNLPSEQLGTHSVQKTFFNLAQTIESDSLLSDVFVKQVANMTVASESADAMLNSLNSIQSDYQMREAMTALAKSSNHERHLVDLVKLAQNEIHSDYELASLLLQIIDDNEISQELQEQVYTAANSIDSDYERSRVLNRLIDIVISQ